MKVLQNAIFCAVLVGLAGCSTLGSDGKRIDYGTDAMQVPSLEVPPDLTSPGSGERFKIPLGDGSISAATYSDYSKSSASHVATVLPIPQWVHIEREGAQRWLKVRDDADNVWPVVKAFWQELGLPLRNEEPGAGIMETEWVENRANSKDQSGQAFDSAHSAGTRDQYITRLARGKDGVSTEVHITHRGIREELSANSRSTRWKARANDSELEAIMLQRLMLRFGAGEAQAANALETTPPSVTATTESASDPAGTASLRETPDGGLIIVVNDPFDRSWRKAGLAIENSRLEIEDKDREKGIYYLRPIKIERGFWDSMKFWKTDEDTDRQYRVIVKDGGVNCEVTVTDQDGASGKASKQMLEALYSNINKQ